ncbi:FdhC protein [Clostridia bacterium]|nr:FdhC protein [Clostridia bacterium]
MQIISAYAEAGRLKTERQPIKTLVLAVFAGMVIALGGAAANTAAFAADNPSSARLAAGLIFPFGLGIIMILGLELFTGNCMIPISILEKKTTAVRMLRNWALVFMGNFIGALLAAVGCALFGQLDYSSGALAVYTVRAAVGKCSLGFGDAVVRGFFCNVLVCAGVLCSLSAADTAGKILGAYIPVALFVICGFEHSVANMYGIPAGLLAMSVPKYAELVQAAGIDTSALTWGNFVWRNLIPVTVGNILGGALLGIGLRFAHEKSIDRR